MTESKLILVKAIGLMLLCFFLSFACVPPDGSRTEQAEDRQETAAAKKEILPAASQPDRYLPLLAGQKVGIMANQTSVVGNEHLADLLLREGVDLRFAFAPEHGFRGDIERGEKVVNDVDAKTGLVLHSLYGKNTRADSIVGSVDVMVFDLQDVGARFYTYIASMHELMQLCADQKKKN